MKSPTVAIVIPMYNAERTIGEALSSVAQQSFRDHVLIVIDDGSTDGSSRIVQDFAATRDNVTLLTQENHGAPYSRNRGIRHAQELAIPFIAFIDADDVWHREKLAWQMQAFTTHADADVVIPRQASYERRNDFAALPFDDARIHPFPDLFTSLCLQDFTFHPASYVAQSTVFREECFYDARFPAGEDFPLFLHFALANLKVLCIDAPLYFERHLPNSLQRRDSSPYHGFRSRVTVIDELLAARGSDPRLTPARVATLLAARDKYLPGLAYGARRYLSYWRAIELVTRLSSEFRDKRAFLSELGKTVLWPMAGLGRRRIAHGTGGERHTLRV